MESSIISETEKTNSEKIHISAIHINDDFRFGVDEFLVPRHYIEDLQCILIPHGLIQDRVIKLAQTIYQDYRGVPIHLLCVLKGGSVFFGDLLRALQSLVEFSERDQIFLTFDFIRAKSYLGTQSTGEVKISAGEDLNLIGKHVVLVEDIVDTGKTMSALIPALLAQGPASVKCATLIQKRTPLNCGYIADFVGFSIPDKFIVGYCMDYNERFRDLKHIAVINESGIRKYADQTNLQMTENLNQRNLQTTKYDDNCIQLCKTKDTAPDC